MESTTIFEVIFDPTALDKEPYTISVVVIVLLCTLVPALIIAGGVAATYYLTKTYY